MPLAKSSKSASNPEFSVVVPVYNEKGNISKLDQEIKQSISKLSKSFEIIYINDGSKDNSLSELKSLKSVKVIDLNRNYGQSTALDAGLREASGNFIFTLDGDGQNDPADFQKLFNELISKNLDVVAGWRRKRADSKKIKILTRIGRFFRRLLIKDIVHDTGCTLRIYRKEAAKSLDLQGEMHRYILPLLRWKGFRIGEVIVNDRPREYGKSAYNMTKAVRGFIDLIYIWFIDKYSQRPLHIFGYTSLFSLLIALASLAESIFARIVWGLSLTRNGFFFLGFFFLLASILFFSFGIIIDLLIRIHHSTSKHEPRYYIRSISNN